NARGIGRTIAQSASNTTKKSSNAANRKRAANHARDGCRYRQAKRKAVAAKLANVKVKRLAEGKSFERKEMPMLSRADAAAVSRQARATTTNQALGLILVSTAARTETMAIKVLAPARHRPIRAARSATSAAVPAQPEVANTEAPSMAPASRACRM